MTFSATTGTPCYHLYDDPGIFTTVVTHLAYGCPPLAIVAAFGLGERTVASWQDRSGQHCQEVHGYLVERPRDLRHTQADEIRAKLQGHVLWLPIAIMVSTRLWLGAVFSHRRYHQLITRLVEKIRAAALARPLLICVDRFAAYVTVVQKVFRSLLPGRKPGRPALIA